MATAYDPALMDLNGWETEPERGPMSREEIVSILREQERASISFRDTVLAQEQASSLDLYEGELFGTEEPGRSQVVARDVAEACDYMQISVQRTIVSGRRVVEFEPGDTDELPELPEKPDAPQLPPPDQIPPEQQQAAQAQMQQFQQAMAQYNQAMAVVKKWEDRKKRAADDATEAVNYSFLRRQHGYRVIGDWIQSGLIEKIGVVKVACVTERKRIKSAMTVQAELVPAMQAQGATISELTLNQDGTASIVVTQEKRVKRYRTYPVPSEEFLFPARTRNEDEAFYIAHRCRKTLSDLVEMGFNRETVDSLPTDEGFGFFEDQRAYSRWRDEDLGAFNQSPMMREVVLMEEYARIDLDDDGIAELHQIFRVGDVILDMNEVDEQPFVVWTPFPRAHRLVGNSLADKVGDLQILDTVLLRQGIDGTFLANDPKIWLPREAETEDTVNDLLTPGPGVIVRGVGATPPVPFSVGFDIQKSLGMLEYVAGLRETRTGITRLNQGLDEDTINKTASGQAALQATGQQIEEYVCRNFGEALGRLFSKLLNLMVANGDPIAIKVDGSYRRVDPSTWDADQMDVAVNVGLGTGRKEQRLLYRQQIAQIQAEALSAQAPIVDWKRAYNNGVGMIRDMSLGDPDDYFIDPDSDDAPQQSQQPAPDPALIKAQADASYQQQKAQMEGEESQRKIALAEQETSAKLGIEHQKGQQTIALQAQRHEQEINLAASKADFEARLAQQTADRNYEIALIQEQHKHELAKQSAEHGHAINMERERNKVPQERPGGDLDK